MASLLPVAEAPILRMYGGGGMVSMLPAAPPVHIAGMHGGGSLLPHAPDVPMIAMRGGGVTAASFGITLFANETPPDTSSCAPITKTLTPLCKSLQPFVDRRVQALLNRVGFSSGDRLKKIGCGEITREDKRLTISFHKNAITLLSGNLTGTFAKFHEGMRRHTPLSVEKSESAKGLLSWMLGSRVDEKGKFNLITFMERMKKENPVLPLKGFHRFLSYHKETVGEMDVLRYAMELYGYRTGAVDTKDVYGLILSTDTAVRRVGDKFAVYNNGAVTSGSWDGSWNSDAGGFAVFEPTLVVAKTSASSGAASASASGAAAPATAKAAAASSPSTSSAISAAGAAAKVAASGAAAATAAKEAASGADAKAAAEAAAKAAASAKNITATTEEKNKQVALNAVFAAHLQVKYNAEAKTNNGMTDSVTKFTGSKNDTTVIVNDYHLIDPYDNNPYYLRGVIHHGGGDNAGHYVYYYRIPGKENEWIRFSDRDVGQPKKRSIDPNVDDLNKGYIYLFEREGSSDGVNKGIQNHGNSCWMNAALQMFYHIKEYREYVEGFKSDSPMIPQNIKDMTLALQQIFQRYSNSPNDAPHIECPTEYKTLFKAVFKNKKEGSQEDTMEFITKVLLGIISPPDRTDFDKGDPRSPIYNLFKLDYSSNLSCSNPYAFSGTAGQIPMLILPVPQHKVNLDTLLYQYSASYPADEDTRIGGRECPDPQKQISFDISHDHKYAILQLSRFT